MGMSKTFYTFYCHKSTFLWLVDIGQTSTKLGLISDFYSAAGRPRCQVTPYVVNVVLLVVVLVGGTVS